MSIVPIAAETAVAIRTASRLMPVCAKTDGLTKRMYDMVKKVVTPARISVMGVLPSSPGLKYRLILFIAVGYPFAMEDTAVHGQLLPAVEN